MAKGRGRRKANRIMKRMGRRFKGSSQYIVPILTSAALTFGIGRAMGQNNQQAMSLAAHSVAPSAIAVADAALGMQGALGQSYNAYQTVSSSIASSKAAELQAQKDAKMQGTLNKLAFSLEASRPDKPPVQPMRRAQSGTF